MKAKTRCDGARPSCARCVARHISCVHPTSKAKSKPRVNFEVDPTYLSDNVSDETLIHSNTSQMLFDTITEYAEATDNLPGSVFTPPSLRLPGWGITHGDLSFKDRWGSAISTFSPPAQIDVWSDQILIAAQSSPQVIPRMPDYHLRSFGQSKSVTARTLPSATLMTHILTYFPRMMYSTGSLPPFIHPYSLGTNVHNPREGFESLTTCVNLMQMISSGAPGSCKLFWKNVRFECERFQAEVPYPPILSHDSTYSRRFQLSIDGTCSQRCRH